MPTFTGTRVCGVPWRVRRRGDWPRAVVIGPTVLGAGCQIGRARWSLSA